MTRSANPRLKRLVQHLGHALNLLPRATPRRRAVPRRPSPFLLEAIEPRLLLAADLEVFAPVVGLTDYSVRLSAAVIQVVDNTNGAVLGSQALVDFGPGNRVRVFGNGANNRLTVDYLSGGGFAVPVGFDGAGGTDTLSVLGTASTFTLDVAVAVSVANGNGPAGRINASGVENIVGGAGDDVFQVNTTLTGINLFGAGGNDQFRFGSVLSGTIDGGAGSDTVQGSTLNLQLDAVGGVDGFGGSDASGSFGAGRFGNIDRVQFSGGSLAALNSVANWQAAAGEMTYATQGRQLRISGDGRLLGGNLSDTFLLSAAVPFKLIGGDGDDVFRFADGARVDGSAAFGGTAIDGGNGIDIIDFSAYASARRVTLQDLSAFSRTFSGSEAAIRGGGINGFVGIDSLIGSSTGGDTLVGYNGDSTWEVDGSNRYRSAVAGVLSNFVDLAGFENLVGGTASDSFTLSGSQTVNLSGGGGADSFVLQAGAALIGSVDGGAGSDTLDLSALAGARNVGLAALGSIDGFAGSDGALSAGFSNIDRLSVGSSNTADTLVGRDAVATWALGAANSYASGGNTLAFSGFDTLVGGSGTDTFNLASSTGALRLRGGAGDDTFVVGSGGNFNAVAGAVTVDGEAGADLLGIDDSADTVANSAVIDATTVTGLGPAAGGVVYSVETLQVSLGSGADTVTVNTTANGTLTSIFGNDGADTFTLLATGSGAPTVDFWGFGGDDTLRIGSSSGALGGGSLNGIASHVGFAGGTGNDRLLLDDGADTVANSGSVSENSVTGLGLAGGLNYFELENLVVQLGRGADALNVLATGVATTINTGAGNDALRLGSSGAATLNALGGALTLNGEAGADSLLLDDSGDASANTGSLASGALTGLGSAGVGFAGFETLRLDLGSGADNLTVLGTAAATTVNAGAGDDQITLGGFDPLRGGNTLAGLQGALVVDGQGGSDSLSLDDSFDVGNSASVGPDTLTGLGLGVGGLRYAGVESLSVFLGNGDDTVVVTGTSAAVTSIFAFGGNDNFAVLATAPASQTTDFWGGAGNDTLRVGSVFGNALGSGTLNAIAGRVGFAGEVGNDTLIVDDGADTGANTGTLAAGAISGLGLGAVGIGYSTVEALTLQLGAGADVLAVQAIPIATTLNLGAGDDSVSVGSPSLATTSALAAALTVNGQAGSDSLLLDDSSDTAAASVSLSASSVVGLSASAVGYSGIESLAVKLGSGGNTVTLLSSAAGSSQTVTGGSGADTFNIAGPVNARLDGGAGADVFRFSAGAVLGASLAGGGGIDLIDASAWTTGVSVNLASGAASFIGGGLGGAVSGIENVFGGSAGDTLVGDGGANLLIGGGGRDSLAGGDGDDSLTVNLIGGAVVDGGTGNDSVTVLGSDTSDSIALAADRVSRAGSAADVVSFTAVEAVSVLGLGGDDSFSAAALAGTLPMFTIDGGSGDDSLSSGSANITWTLSEPTRGATVAGSVFDLRFSAVERLSGGSGSSQLVLAAPPPGAPAPQVRIGSTGVQITSNDAAGQPQNLAVSGVGQVSIGGGPAVAVFDALAPIGLTLAAGSTIVGPVVAGGLSWVIGGIGDGVAAALTLSGTAGTTATVNVLPSTSAAPTQIQVRNAQDRVSNDNDPDNQDDDNDEDTCEASFTIDLGGAAFEAADCINVWTLTGPNSGTLTSHGMPKTFSNAGRLIGGNLSDTFILAPGGSLSGGVDGGGAAIGNRLIAGDGNNSWTLNGLDAGQLSGLGSFRNIANLQGGAGSDSFTLGILGNLSPGGAISGGLGSNTLRGADSANTWAIDAPNAGSVNGIAFSAIGSLVGGSANDRFTLAATGSLSGSIAGGGPAINNTLIGSDVATRWTLSGADAGRIETSSGLGALGGGFSAIGNLTAGSGADAFTLSNAAASLSGLLDGGAQPDAARSNRLEGPDVERVWTLNGRDAGQVAGTDGSSGRVNFTRIGNIAAGRASDTVVLAPATGASAPLLSGSLDGGPQRGADGFVTALNRLIGPNSATRWVVSGADGGSVATPAGVGWVGLGFNNFGSLVGGAGDDVFALTDTGSLLDGVRGGAGVNTLNGSNTATTWTFSGNDAGWISTGAPRSLADAHILPGATAIAFDLPTGLTNGQALQFNAAGGDFAFGAGALRDGEVVYVEFVSAFNTALRLLRSPGPSSAQNPPIVFESTPRFNAGQLTPVAAFQQIQRLQGGDGADLFQIKPSAADDASATNIVSLGIDGGGGVNTLVDGRLGNAADTVSNWTISGVDSGDLVSQHTRSYRDDPLRLAPLLVDQTLRLRRGDPFANVRDIYAVRSNIDGTRVEVEGRPTDLPAHIERFDRSQLTAALRFDHVQWLRGGNAADNFFFERGGSLNGGVDGVGAESAPQLSQGANVIYGLARSASDDVTGRLGDLRWTVSGPGQGSVVETSVPAGRPLVPANGFVNINLLQGGSGNDDVVLQAGGSVTGGGLSIGIDGGLGSNRLQGPDAATSWALNRVATGGQIAEGRLIAGISPATSGGTGFSRFQQLQGGSADDRFRVANLAFSEVGIDGGAGSNTLVADAAAGDWSVTGADAGTLRQDANSVLGRGFTRIGNLVGSPRVDTFTVNRNASLSGTVDGGSGAARDNTLTIVEGPLGATQWRLTGANAGTTNVVAGFVGIGQLRGGSGADSLELAGGSLAGSFDGGGPALTNTLRSSLAQSTTWTVTGSNRGTVKDSAGASVLASATAGDGFANVGQLVGGLAPDTFVLRDGAKLDVGLDGGGSGLARLQADAANGRDLVWLVDGANRGSVNSTEIRFLNIASLQGGVERDTFRLGAAAALSGAIGGGSQPGLDTLENLGTSAADWLVSAPNTGTLRSGGQTFVFTAIGNLLGGGGHDSFVVAAGARLDGINSAAVDGGGGDNDLTVLAPSQWLITGLNAGQVPGVVPAFNRIQNVFGGPGADRFTLLTGGSLFGSGLIDGGAGSDTLTGADQDTAWTLTGADSGSVSGVKDGFVHIEVVQGGTAADTVAVGDGVHFTGTVDLGGGADRINVAGSGRIDGPVSGGSNTPGSTDIADYSASTGPLTLRLGVTGLSNFEAIVGNGSNSTLIGGNTANDWTLSGAGSGSVGGQGFSAVGQVRGGNGADTFVITSGASFSGVIDGAGGDDLFLVRSSTAALVLSGGDGDDTFRLGSLQPAAGGTLNAIAGALTIAGDAGSNRLIVDDSGDASANSATVSASVVSGLGMGPSGVAYSSVNALELVLGNGANTVNLTGTAAGTATTVVGGAGAETYNIRATGGSTTVLANGGNDTVSIGSLAPAGGGTLAAINGALSVDTGSGNDALVIDDGGRTTTSVATLSATGLTGLSTGAITYTGAESLTLQLGLSKTNVLDITGTHAGSTTVNGGNDLDSIAVAATGGPTLINTGAGNDAVSLSKKVRATDGTLLGFLYGDIAAGLVVNAGSGTDQLSFNDGLQTAARTLTLGPGNFTGMGTTVSFNGVENLSLALGTGANLVTVNSSVSGLTSITGGSGNERFVVQASGGAVAIDAGAGDDAIGIGSTVNGGVETSFTLNGLTGNVSVQGGTGNDRLLVSDAGNAGNASRAMTENTISTVGRPSIGYGGVELLTLTLADGADSLQVSGTAAGTATTINGRGGNDRIGVAGTAGDGQNHLLGALSVNGGGGTFSVDDSANTALSRWSVDSALVIDQARGGVVSYANVSAFEFTSGQNSGIVQVLGTSAGALSTISGAEFGALNVYVAQTSGELRLFGSRADDVFTVQTGNRGAQALRGRVSVAGLDGNDVLLVDAKAAPPLPNVIVTATQLTGLSGNDTDAIVYGGIESLRLDLPNGNDNGDGSNVWVQSTNTTVANPGVTVIVGGDGFDSFRVSGVDKTLNGIRGLLSIDGGPARVIGSVPPVVTLDKLEIDASGATTPLTGAIKAPNVFGMGMGPAGLEQTGIEALTIRLGQGDDSFGMEQSFTQLPQLVTVFGGPGNDSFFGLVVGVIIVPDGHTSGTAGLASAAQTDTTAAAQFDAVRWVGEDGIDTLVVDDSRQSAVSQVLLTSTSVSVGNASQAYQAVERINVVPSAAGASYSIASTAPGTTLKLAGGAGDDMQLLTPTAADIEYDAGAGNNVVKVAPAGSGPFGKITIRAGDGNNTIIGGAGDDTIIVGNGANLIFGGGGADTIRAGDGMNLIFGDQGRIGRDADPVEISNLDLDSGGNDNIVVGNGNNIIFGGAGADSIATGNGNNIVFGDYGKLVFRQGLLEQAEGRGGSNAGADTLITGSGNDLIFGGGPTDQINPGAGRNSVFNEAGKASGSALIDWHSAFAPAPWLQQPVNKKLAAQLTHLGGAGDRLDPNLGPVDPALISARSDPWQRKP